jgi:hypothetical protein
LFIKNRYSKVVIFIIGAVMKFFYHKVLEGKSHKAHKAKKVEILAMAVFPL